MLNKTQNPYYSISKIDNLFFELYNYYPIKEGQAYELLVGSVLKILNPEQKIIWNKRVKGDYDQNNYQIDVSIYEINNESIMVEAKDHTKRKKPKVNRPEIDKIAGSLIEVNYESGYFFSATDYTRDAKKKAEGSKKNPNAKNISLFHIRESDKRDEKNRIQTIKINFSLIQIDNSKLKIAPKLDEEDIKTLFPTINKKENLETYVEFKFENKTIECHGEFINESKENIGHYRFVKSLPENLFSIALKNKHHLSGEWNVDNGFIRIFNNQIPLKKVIYDIGFKDIVIKDEIKAKGTPKIFVKSEDGELNKLITDNQLKGISFKKDGEIKFDNSTA